MYLTGTMLTTEFAETGTNSPLLRLLTGEQPDSLGTYVPVEDRWERDPEDPNILYSPGSRTGVPTNLNQIPMKIKWIGSIAPYSRVCEFQLSIKIKKPGAQYDSWSDFTEDGGRILIAYPAADTELQQLSVQYFISVTKDRIIINTLGITDPIYTPHTNLLYIGTFQTFMPLTVDYHPATIISTHCTPEELYYQANNYEDGFHMHIGCNEVDIASGKINPWMSRGRGEAVKIMNLGEDSYTQVPNIGSWSGGYWTGHEDPNQWPNKWYFYPLFLLSGEYLGRNFSNDQVPDLRNAWRGRLLDVYAFSQGGDWNTLDFSNLDVLSDGDISYRLVIPSSVTYSGVTSPGTFGKSFTAALAWRQR